MTARVLLVPAPGIAAELDVIVARLIAAGLSVDVRDADALDGPAVAGVEVIAGPGTLRCDASLFDRAVRLRGLVSIGSGCEGFDRDAADGRGIAIYTGATRENVVGMASATIMLMLALCHDLPAAAAAARAGRRRSIARARPLDDMVVGLIGYGAIGQEVARRLRAWDVTTIAYTPSRTSGTIDGVRFRSLDDVLTGSDVISLHAALTARSRHLLNRDRLAMLKPGALLVNTARGGLIDEDALARLLGSGAIGAAALDCFEVEPLSADSPLCSAPNVILTPHQIGHTAAGATSVIDALVANIERAASIRTQVQAPKP